ncbi:replication protein [Paraburkholderia elongata]|uniref:Bacteriophage lambda Replication protein O N-terminal domain-containing protein n=1 Tax=Paraburkholderia elongata TaxID=2675747 RepID=A0A972NSL2_9BURK|nr:replication protein [Paraburkholderia elongata]NPT59066.1 hypothetical protein [Paraburkholderia elongata]
MEEASPQLEDGYTKLANELLEALIGAGLTARQWAVVMAIIRKTYGFNKKADEIGLSQLAAMTGIDKTHLSRTVRELEAAKVIHRQVGTHAHSLSINKKHSQWGLLKEQRVAESATVAERATVTKSATGGCRISTGGVAESAHLGLLNEQPQNTTQKTTQKTTPKEIAPSGKISLDAEGDWVGIPTRLMAKWQQAYPALSLDAELSKASAWIIANPKNKKSNYARFLTNWLTRAQDKAPKQGGGNEQDNRPKLVL